MLDDVGYLTSDSALTLESLPNSIIVLGGGAVAVEFAQFFSRFGVKVTLIQRSPHCLHEVDTDAATVIETVFRREGIEVFTGTKLLGAAQSGRARASRSSTGTTNALSPRTKSSLGSVVSQTQLASTSIHSD